MMTLPRTSATARAILGPDAEWGISDHLLAYAADLLAVANYQRAGRGPKPKPFPRPGVGPKVERVEMDSFESPAAFDEWWATH